MASKKRHRQMHLQRPVVMHLIAAGSTLTNCCGRDLLGRPLRVTANRERATCPGRKAEREPMEVPWWAK